MSGSDRKRPRHQSRASHRRQKNGGGGGGRNERGWRSGGGKNPRRGGPGVLLTCDGGREGKCRREGISILRHYYYASQNKTDKKKGGDGAEETDGDCEPKNDERGVGPSAVGKEKELSLDEEIALLQGGASADEVLHVSISGASTDAKRKSPFVVYDTGCKGTVFVMCSLPNCDLIPAQGPEATVSDETKIVSDNGMTTSANESGDCGGDRNATKKRKFEVQDGADGSKVDEASVTPPWDPMDTVHRVLDDLSQTKALTASDAPGSRFVTRMIPIQATCFASLEEIHATARSLLNKFLFPNIVTDKKSKSTFAITFKRRNCSHLKRDNVIEVVAKAVEELRTAYAKGSSGGCEKQDRETTLPELSVDLSNPDYTVQVEVCRTLCGMSVVPRIASFHNFSLFAIRQQNEEGSD
mmetsp:Transcript_27625/g.81217  ORF Transcript_27625/g.81217 Transcript_27625/m.81217 type:complete len:412 (-) Transcript_27625:355-1590(-)